jgi:prolipoprotein diacylglyceryl transferase
LASFPSPDSGLVGPLRLYGILIAAGVIAAVWLSSRRYAHRGGDPKLIESIALPSVIAGLIGARIYHVITDWKRFRGDWLEALAIWKGGLGIWGGIALGVAVGALLVRRKGARVLPMMDIAAPALALAQAIGRWGNYANQELFGRPTSVPWAVEIDPEHRPDGYLTEATFHPTFLYESLWCLAIVAFLYFSERRWKLRSGQLFCLYVTTYCVGRTYFETLRIDEASHIGSFRVNELVAPAVGLLGLVAFFVLGRRPEPEPEEELDPEGSEGDVEGEGEASAGAAGEEELGDVDDDRSEAPALEDATDSGRAGGHDDGGAHHD